MLLNHKSTSNFTVARDSWSLTYFEDEGSIKWHQFQLNESLIDFIVNGSCGRMLGEALPEFCNLRSFCIMPPTFSEEIKVAMTEKMFKDINCRWALASKVLLTAVFTGVHKLDAFSIDIRDSSLWLPLSATGAVVAHWPSWLSSLKNMQLHMGNDLDECMC